MPARKPLEGVSVRDGIATGGRLLAEGTRLGLARVMGRRDEPTGIADIDRAWLTRAFQAEFPGCRVRAVEPLTTHAGTTARARLRVTYEEVGDGASPPTMLFAKLAPGDVRTRLFVNLLRLGGTEVRFYREIAASVPGERPRVYVASATGRAGGFVLLLEDLATRGARFTDVSQPLVVEDARRVMGALARLHAAFWESPRFHTDLAWLRTRAHNPLYRVERFMCARAVPVGLRKFAELVPPELHAAASRIIAARDDLEDAWSHGPRTLVHGDAHAGNIYFLPDSVGFLDWQVVQRGQGMRDLSYFLANSLPTDVRRQQERALLALYLHTLGEYGVTPLTFDRAWQQYRLHVVYAWIGAAVTAAAATLQETPIVRTALARTSHAVLDLDALGALRALEGGVG